MQTIRGTVDTVFFSSPNFTAGMLRPAPGSNAGPLNFAGKLFVSPGECVALVGEWHQHPKYGKQFKVETMAYELELNADGLANWLANHPDAHGIGPIRAGKVAREFGADFSKALAETPELVTKVAGIPLENIKALAKSWFSRLEWNNLATKLAAWELTHHQITKLLERHGASILSILDQDPYTIIKTVEGIGFRRADEIAQKLGTPKDHPGRVRAAIMYAIQRAADDGSTLCKISSLLDPVDQLLALDSIGNEDLVGEQFQELIDGRDLFLHECDGSRWVALPWLARQEAAIFGFLRKSREPNRHFAPEAVPALVSTHGLVNNHWPMDDSQKRGLENALRHRVSVITGPAGTGKTTLVQAIVRAYQEAKRDVVLCAPTGKAARRIDEVVGCGLNAVTIHKLLGANPNGQWFKDASNPVNGDVVIADEFSMTDVPLAYRLFDAIGRDTSVILVGDHNQLSSVGPGAVLRDIIARSLAPVTILEHCHRQAGPLKINSSGILKDRVAKTEKIGYDPGPWYVLPNLNDPEDILKKVESLFREKVSQWGFDRLTDVQILTPIHKGPVGTMALNLVLQRIHQESRGVEVPEVPAGHKPKLFPGDKVIYLRNNYDLDVMNGHQGTVVESKRSLIIRFENGVKHIPHECEGEVALAYALTIHKTQGSEYPCVVIVCHHGHSFQLHRNLLYTACTRARKTCIILGDEWAIRTAALRVKENLRTTLLSILEKDSQ